MRDKLRSWLSPPDPSVNHNTACKTQHGGTATWFIQGSIFRDWKMNGSLLWVRGNRKHSSLLYFRVHKSILEFAAGAGKSILWCAVSRSFL